jgi:hypothetical protein
MSGHKNRSALSAGNGRAARAKRHRSDWAYASTIMLSGHTSGTTSLGDYSAPSTLSTRQLAPKFKVSVARPAMPVVSQPPVGARWDFELSSQPVNDYSGVKYVVTDAHQNSVSRVSLLSPFFPVAHFTLQRTCLSNNGGPSEMISDLNFIVLTPGAMRFTNPQSVQDVPKRTARSTAARTACAVTCYVKTACSLAMRGCLYI